jgi:hypothetical protein
MAIMPKLFFFKCWNKAHLSRLFDHSSFGVRATVITSRTGLNVVVLANRLWRMMQKKRFG